MTTRMLPTLSGFLIGAAQQPEGVPAENWLPINRKDEGIDLIMRIYVPDLEKMKTWEAPKAEKL